MIYICIPSHDEGPTVGLLLWKVRKVFAELGREYQFLVADDASTDDTSARLAPYTKVLPLTVVRHRSQRGAAASAEALLRLAAERSDRPNRDCAVVMHADFTHGAEHVPELVRRIDSGADLVVGEATLEGVRSRSDRWLRHWAPRLISAGIPKVHDLASGFLAVRLGTVGQALPGTGGAVTASGWAGNAELIARLASQSRRIETVPVVERHDRRQRPPRSDTWQQARGLWASRRLIRQAGEAAS